MSCFVEINEKVKIRLVGRPGKCASITLGGTLLPVYPFFACKADVTNFLTEGLTVEQIDENGAKVGDITMDNIDTIFSAFRVALTLSKYISSVSYQTLTYAVRVTDLDGKEITEGLDTVALTSSNEAVATVGQGTITLVGPGRVDIKCVYNGEFEGVASLLVTEALDVTVSTGLVSLKVGEQPVAFDYSEASGSLNSDAFEVTIEDPAVAQIVVDKAARKVTVTPVAEGNTSVTVKIKDTTVVETVAIAVAPADVVEPPVEAEGAEAQKFERRKK